MPDTTGFNGKTVDDIKGYLEHNYDMATNVNDYEWKNDKKVQEAIKEIAEDDEKVAPNKVIRKRVLSLQKTCYLKN